MHKTLTYVQGGKEASRSNVLLHSLIVEAVAEAAPTVGRDLISLVTSRQGVDDLLKLDDVIDLVRLPLKLELQCLCIDLQGFSSFRTTAFDFARSPLAWAPAGKSSTC